ncbi:thermonuclease family protein [Allomesorhizobium camelthorni]|uniref:Thermonuclease family protein n=1 Tax=Allomesorhizobium camelthorni TaxID=475069 RepID=A0A6G4WIE9_9HYPH|nr:hypothetical protein [Mesorhizobium camelthorni]NGO54572.1 hypothetical protein [Mesorhizobium camelthorni]
MSSAITRPTYSPGFPAAKATASNPSSLVGHASVIDGDTIEIHGERVRFNGIDAPEATQTCKDGNGATYRCGARAAEWRPSTSS